jgi:thioredoxin-like negative regulator of GroEL
MFAMKYNLIKMPVLPILCLWALNNTAQAAGEVIDAHDTTAKSSVQTAAPENSVIKGMLNKARQWKKQNRLDLASGIWNRILQSNPNEEEALAEMAMYQAGMQQTAKAKEYQAKLKHVNPNNPAIEQVDRMLSYQSNKPAWEKLAAADHLIEQSQFEAAEAGYRDTLNQFPGFALAREGLANSLIKQKKYDAALGILDQHDAQGRNQASVRLRKEAYIGKATAFETAGNLNSALVFLNKAKTLGALDQWATLTLARVLEKQGNTQAAQDEIDGMTKGSRDPQKLYVGALYYAENKQWDKAKSLLGKIDARDKEKDSRIQELNTRVEVYGKTVLAKTQYADHTEQDAINTLSKAENQAAGMPNSISLIVAAWMEIKDSDRAISLLERSKPLTPDLQLQYAGVLLQSYQEVKLEKLLNEIDHQSNGANINAEALDQIRIAFYIRKADGLGRKQRTEEGLALLSPLMHKYPKNVDLILAHARLLGTQESYHDALKDVDAALVISPANHEAIRQGAVYAVHLKNYPLADHYLSLSEKDADRASLYVEAGHAAEAVQNIERAVTYFDIASQLGATDVPILVLAPEEKPSETIQAEAAPTPPATQPVVVAETPAATDQKAVENAERKTKVEVAYSSFNKSGQAGLGYLSAEETPVAIYIPYKESNRSTFVIKASQVTLNSGDVAPSITSFGTNLHTTWPSTTPYLVQAQGTSLSVGYQSDSLFADLGVSPQGFKTNNTVGGIRWGMELGRGANLSAEISRRSVAESVVSFAGAADNLTNRVWGGVNKTGMQLGLYSPLMGDFALYTGLGYYNYAGTNVADNASNSQSASLIYSLLNSDSQAVSLSARLSRASFQQNQNWFTFGHGGYYSPKSDVSFGIPFHWAGKTGKLGYEFNVIGSIANTEETSSPIYPTEPALGAGMYPATTITSKFSRGVDWTIEYQLESQLTIGNRLSYNDATNNFQQRSALIYLRYDFDKKGSKLYFPPNPIKPYYITTQGGAGHN